MAFQLPMWAQLLLGFVALVGSVLVGSYVALGKKVFKERKASSLASAILGFLLAPIFVAVAGLMALPGSSSALLMLMWIVLLRNLQKVDWPSSIGLALACVLLTYMLYSWCGFSALLTPWWRLFI
ncbi:hypothetical protein DRO32_00995 [Candidatus Bathyarchaeota archaeon]|nr:MAG: hypothetical protein DRO32_00995 [Candidatus Bathyarchaeota archaeon]